MPNGFMGNRTQIIIAMQMEMIHKSMPVNRWTICVFHDSDRHWVSILCTDTELWWLMQLTRGQIVSIFLFQSHERPTNAKFKVHGHYIIYTKPNSKEVAITPRVLWYKMQSHSTSKEICIWLALHCVSLWLCTDRFYSYTSRHSVWQPWIAWWCGQVTEVRLSCYLVLLSTDSKTR